MAPRECEPLQMQGGVPVVHAANLDVVHESCASPEVQRLYGRFRAEFNRPHVPGILQCFATHPSLLDHMMGIAMEMLFADGALGRRHKEMLSAFVSASNRCAYCADSHAHSFRIQGGTPDTMNALLQCDLNSDAITPGEQVLLRFAQKVSDDSEAITRADMDGMRAAGWSDLQIAEAIHVTALFATFNRVVNAFGLPSQNLLRTLEQGVDHA